MAARYGPVVYRRGFGGQFHVVDVQNTKLIRQVLSNKHSISRPPLNVENGVYIQRSDKGIFSFADINGSNWQKRRQLAQSVLFRSCTSSFVNKIVDESIKETVFPAINNLIENKQLWYPSKLLYFTAFNSLFHANFGRSIDIKDPIYLKSVDFIKKSFSLFLPSFLISSLHPLLRKIIIPHRIISEIHEIVNERSKTYTDLVEIRKKEYDPNNPTAYIDFMFNECKDNDITLHQMEMDIQALFAAGTDTTASTLEYAVILTARDINIQEKVRKELINCYNHENNDNNGNIRTFDILWLKKLPLFRAFIHEIMRISSVAKVGLPHWTTNDIEIDVGSVINDGSDDNDDKKYIIPSNSVILYHIEACHIERKDENWKKTGKEIHLENWLNKNGKFEKNDSWITFGFGRRDCVGRELAMKEIHIVMAYLLLNYKLEIGNENDKTREITYKFNGVKSIQPPIGIIVTKVV